MDILNVSLEELIAAGGFGCGCGRHHSCGLKYLKIGPGAVQYLVDALKAAYDEYERLKWLQYEFMENHEKLGEGVYRVTYSDGTRITVDYNREDYTVEKAK